MSGTARFLLVRDVDHSGISGTGEVAEGVQFSDGTVALRWRGEHASTVLWRNIEDALAIHGRDGSTRPRWLDTLSTGLAPSGYALPPAEEIPDGISDADLLEWMGTDAARWAQAFAGIATEVDEGADEGDFIGWLTGWFANAIQAGVRSK